MGRDPIGSILPKSMSTREDIMAGQSVTIYKNGGEMDELAGAALVLLCTIAPFIILFAAVGLIAACMISSQISHRENDE